MTDFAGSDKKHDSLPKSLTLNNEDRRAPIDYSEMALTRRINRAGGEYFINKSEARLHVQLMLAKVNFGQPVCDRPGMVDSFLVVSRKNAKSCLKMLLACDDSDQATKP